MVVDFAVHARAAEVVSGTGIHIDQDVMRRFAARPEHAEAFLTLCQPEFLLADPFCPTLEQNHFAVGTPHIGRLNASDDTGQRAVQCRHNIAGDDGAFCDRHRRIRKQVGFCTGLP